MTDLNQLSTHRLLQIYRQERQMLLSRTEEDWEYIAWCNDQCDVEPEDEYERLDRIKAILDSREHVPSRADRKGQKRKRRLKTNRRGNNARRRQTVSNCCSQRKR